MNPPAILSVTDRFALIIDGLCRAVAARSLRGVMAETLIWLILRRLNRAVGVVRALGARLSAGTLGFRVVRADLPRVRVAGAGLAALPAQWPRRFGWLIPLVPYAAAGFASQLRHLLADPEMAMLLAASPRLRRMLRPLCRMLAIEAALLAPCPVPQSAAVAVEELAADTVARADTVPPVWPGSPVPTRVRRDGEPRAVLVLPG